MNTILLLFSRLPGPHEGSARRHVNHSRKQKPKTNRASQRRLFAPHTTESLDRGTTMANARRDQTRHHPVDQELLALLAKRKTSASRSPAPSRPIPVPSVTTSASRTCWSPRSRKGAPGLDAQYITRIYHTIIEDSVLSQQAYLQSLLNPSSRSP